MKIQKSFELFGDISFNRMIKLEIRRKYPGKVLVYAVFPLLIASRIQQKSDPLVCFLKWKPERSKCESNILIFVFALSFSLIYISHFFICLRKNSQWLVSLIETYSETFQTSKMERFAKIFYGLLLLDDASP